jgi:hypothetical protein
MGVFLYGPEIESTGMMYYRNSRAYCTNALKILYRNTNGNLFNKLASGAKVVSLALSSRPQVAMAA